MIITKVSYERLDLQLAIPYTIAYETITKATNFILKLETESSLVGFGCSAPDPLVTGESPIQAEEAIKDIVVPHLIGKDPFTYAFILAELRVSLECKSSTLTMVDMALYDLISKKAKVPLYRFLGGYRESMPTSITIGILALDETIAQAKNLIGQGFTILKIKGGGNLKEDIEKMVKIRELFPNITLRFDGNQGYTVDESIAFVKETAKVGIEIFEQPTQLGQEENLGKVTGQVHIPVMADESLKTLKDVFRLARKGSVDMINLKLMKVGGIMEGMHINSVAKAANLEVMVGCNDECALGIAAGLHFALSRPNICYADLDGHLDLLNDPFIGLFHLKNGILFPTTSAGLGNVRFKFGI